MKYPNNYASQFCLLIAREPWVICPFIRWFSYKEYFRHLIIAFLSKLQIFIKTEEPSLKQYSEH